MWNCDGRTWRSVGGKAFGDNEMSRRETIVLCEKALSTKLVAMTIMLEDMMGTKLMSMIKLIDGFVNWGFWKKGWQ